MRDNTGLTAGGMESQTPSLPLVTVVVPAYDAARYLPDCIRSVLAQTERRWLLRIVDDGSPDNCAEIARSFAASDGRISVISRPNGGLSAARNTGLEHITTPYVTFLDADDLLLPECLASLLEMQQGRTDRISCLSNFRFRHTDTLQEIIRNHSSSKASGMKSSEAPLLVMTPEKAIRHILYQRILDHSACGKLYPAAMVPPGIFTEGIGYEDLDAFYRIFLRAADIAFRPLPLYGYRSNPQSYTHTFTERRADVLDVAERMLAYMDESHPALAAPARSRLLSAYFNIHALASADQTPHPEILQRCWKGIRRLRREALSDGDVRMKNKIAALASYAGGQWILTVMARFLKGSI